MVLEVDNFDLAGDDLPLVSIIMPVYNAEIYLKEAIDSILGQVYKNIELIIIDDCSSDNSVKIIKSYDDNRIRFIRNEVNLKQPRTRNKGISLANGKYIANMDADDISLPERIAKQVAFMEKHTEIDVCGTAIKCFGGAFERIWKYPVESRELLAWSVINSPFAHPTVMIRKSSIEKYKIQYSVDFKYAQDFELWSRLALQGCKFHNLPDVLLHYRESETGVGRSHKREQQMLGDKIRCRNLKKVFSFRYKLKSIECDNCEYISIKEDIDFLIRSMHDLPSSKIFSSIELQNILSECIKQIALKNTHHGYKIFIVTLKAIGYFKADKMWWTKLFLKCLIKYNPISMTSMINCR